MYRIGYEGKVDLKYVEDAPDGYYYRDHLPITGEDSRTSFSRVLSLYALHL